MGQATRQQYRDSSRVDPDSYFDEYDTVYLQQSHGRVVYGGVRWVNLLLLFLRVFAWLVRLSAFNALNLVFVAWLLITPHAFVNTYFIQVDKYIGGTTSVRAAIKADQKGSPPSESRFLDRVSRLG